MATDDDFSAKAATGPKGPRPAKKSDDFSAKKFAAEAKAASEAMSIRSIYYNLADSFINQPWIHTYRGDTERLGTVKVGLGPKLVAKLIAEQVASDKSMKGWSDERISSVVDYAMKHFFDRVPNDERDPNGVLRRFLHPDWWDHLIEESVDHFAMVNVDMPTFEESQRKVEEFYADWPKPEPRRPRPKTVAEAAARFNEVYARRMAEIESADSLTNEEPLL